MEENVLGLIKLVGEPFAPKGWMFCEGQYLATSMNQALYSLIGNTYGGSGFHVFALPDMRDPENMRYHKGFGPERPLKYVICVSGYYPDRP